MARHSNPFAVGLAQHLHSRQLANALSPAASSSAPTTSTTTTSPNTPTDSTSTAGGGSTDSAGSTPGTGSTESTTGTGSTPSTGSTTGTGLTSSTGSTTGTGSTPSTGSTTGTSPTTGTGSTTGTDSTTGTGSKTETGSTTGSGSTTGNTESGSTKSGSATESAPLIALNGLLPLSNQSTTPATPASQAAKPATTPVINTPVPVATVVSSVMNQTRPSATPSITTATNPAGVVVTETLYPAAKPTDVGSNTLKSAPVSSASAAPSDDNTGTSVGTIMGIVVAALIGAVILGGVVGMFFKRKKQRMINDFDDNPFLNDKYGTDNDHSGSPSESHGLTRSGTGTTRTGGATGPRPPSILERHWGAPALPPPAPAFQPGQNYNASQFASPGQFNQAYNLYPGQQSGGYGAEHSAYGDGLYGPEHSAYGEGGYGADHSPYGGSHPGPPPSHTAYGSEFQGRNSSDLQREPSLTSNGGGPPPFDSHAYGYAPEHDRKEGYKAQVAQMDFALGGGRLKNPYGTDDALRSGTPVQPNIQQSYFAHSHPESFASSPEASRITQPRDVRDQRREGEAR